MRLFITSLIAALGMTSLIGGLCALCYGIMHPGPTWVNGLGPLNGVWPAENYCFLGGILAAVGGGVATFGFAMRKTAEEEKPF